MNLISIEFFFFFVLVAIVYSLLNRDNTIALRNMVLLIASSYFYASFHPTYLLLLAYIILVNFFGTKYIASRLNRGLPAKLSVGIVILLSLGVLAFMKYAYIWNSSILLPVGLSFFTFQALTYTIDVYRGKIEQERDFVKVALFISFFPTILSGPIERARNILPQLGGKTALNYDNLSGGAKRFIWGMFKKMVIADRLAMFVDSIYVNPEIHTGSTLGLAALFYSIQIYCDFSGYADMAIGIGQMLGFKLMENFRFPYFAATIKEFWHRWHISLTTWFTEYVYISMGGNRVNLFHWILNIVTVFLLSGIWHGATVSFIIWGSIHATAYLIEHFFVSNKNPSPLYGLVCFIVVTLAWVFFRLENSEQAIMVISRICTDITSPLVTTVNGSTFSFLVTCGLLLLFGIREFTLYKMIGSKQSAVEMIVIVLLIALFSAGNSQFVYFQF